MKQQTLSILFGAAALGAALAPATAAPQERVQVVTTLPVLADLAREVGGDRVRAVSLADPRQDPHYIEPRPTLMQRAREADLFVEVGLQLELWAEKVVQGSGNPSIQLGQPGRVIASAGIRTVEQPQVLSREWGDVHPYGNPHVWLDPLNAKQVAESIGRGLERVDPAHAAEYAERLKLFQDRIDRSLFGEELVELAGGGKLDRLARQGRLVEYLESRDLAGKLGGWLALAAPLRGRPVVTYHKTYAYMADRFGFTVPIEIEEKPGIQPSARHRDRVLELMRRQGVRTILQDLFYDRSAADWLAERSGARVAVVPIDVGAEVGAPSYFDLIDLVLRRMLASEAGG